MKLLFPGLIHSSLKMTLLKIWLLISAFHVCFFSTLISAFWLDNRKGPFIVATFSDSAYDPLAGSLIRCLSLWLSGLPLAFIVQRVVQYKEHCFDYMLCVFLFNMFMTTIYSGFPIDYNWYVSFGLHASGTSLLAEYLCGRSEKKIADRE